MPPRSEAVFCVFSYLLVLLYAQFSDKETVIERLSHLSKRQSFEKAPGNPGTESLLCRAVLHCRSWGLLRAGERAKCSQKALMGRMVRT